MSEFYDDFELCSSSLYTFYLHCVITLCYADFAYAGESFYVFINLRGLENFIHEMGYCHHSSSDAAKERDRIKSAIRAFALIIYSLHEEFSHCSMSSKFELYMI